MSGNADSEARVRITIGDRSIEAKLADSDAARDFASAPAGHGTGTAVGDPVGSASPIPA